MRCCRQFVNQDEIRSINCGGGGGGSDVVVVVCMHVNLPRRATPSSLRLIRLNFHASTCDLCRRQRKLLLDRRIQNINTLASEVISRRKFVISHALRGSRLHTVLVYKS